MLINNWLAVENSRSVAPAPGESDDDDEACARLKQQPVGRLWWLNAPISQLGVEVGALSCLHHFAKQRALRILAYSSTDAFNQQHSGVGRNAASGFNCPKLLRHQCPAQDPTRCFGGERDTPSKKLRSSIPAHMSLFVTGMRGFRAKDLGGIWGRTLAASRTK